MTEVGGDAERWRLFIDAAQAAIDESWEELSHLDQAIGDGDHGANLRRGIDALQARSDDVAALPFDEACKLAGMTLVMSIGGASGPLLGSMLIGFGEVSDRMPSSQAEAAAMLRAGLKAVMKRGRSAAGSKTMLDVLDPVTSLLERDQRVSLDQVRQEASRSAEATKGMVAIKGRAAFLGERSRGHVDPGAASLSLLLGAICMTVGKAA